MDEDSQVQVLEGTWEEISQYGSELAGRRVRVVVLDEPAAPPDECDSTEEPIGAERTTDSEEWRRKFDQWLAEAETVVPEPRTMTPATEFEQILIEKFRKQGLDVY
jgi:hypothetical protein